MNILSAIIMLLVLATLGLFTTAAGRKVMLAITHHLAINSYGDAGTSSTLTKTTDAAWTTQNLVVMKGTDDAHVNLADGSIAPLGFAPDAPASGDLITVQLPGKSLDGQTKRAVSSAAVTLNAEAVIDASNPGKLINIPTATAGSYWVVGRFAATTSAAGPVIVNDVVPYLVKLVQASGVTTVAGVTGAFNGANVVRFF
jgi:hypothetical protein